MDRSQQEKAETEETITISNEPSFKLDEPVTTILNTNPTVTTNFNVYDEDSSSLSFVVLDKDSLETVQASLLASYVDIQQKSMSIDYKSMISSLSIDEMQQRLTEILQENVKLKETLKQNNLSMKHQFNSLVTWQEEVMKVHYNHKQKFAETRELINALKKENAELKTKLSFSKHVENIEFEEISIIPESDITGILTNQTKLQQNMSELTGVMLKTDVEECKQNALSVTSEKFPGKELYNNLQLKVEKELVTAMKTLNCNSSQTSIEIIENQKCAETCSAKDKKITSLQESIALLEQKLQCAFIPIQLHDLSESSLNLDHQKFVQNMKEYNDILQELTQCFVAQIDRFTVLQRNLKEITDILITIDDDNTKMQFYQYREKLCHYCKQLADEQVKIINDRQTLIKSQNQFQKILSDYKSIVYKLEITIDENAKLNVLKDNTARENLRKFEELERMKLNKQWLEEQKRYFDEEKFALEDEKKSLESQKKNFDMMRESLDDEKKLLAQKNISLNEEKMSLDQQSQLYENCKKALEDKKKLIQARYEQLLDTTENLQQKIKDKNTEFEEIMKQLAQSTEENSLLKLQLKLHEEDFKQEKKLKESLLKEKSQLEMELQKQVNFNKQLQKTGSYEQTTSSDVTLKQTSKYPIYMSTEPDDATVCPICMVRFQSVPILMKHIDDCLTLSEN